MPFRSCNGTGADQEVRRRRRRFAGKSLILVREGRGSASPDAKSPRFDYRGRMRSPRPRWGTRLALIGLAACFPLSSRAAETSRCPTVEAVRAELAALAPGDRAGARLTELAGAEGPSFTVVDLGVSFRIAVGERAREYPDEAHDCAYRARVAALFLALAVAGSEDPGPVPAPPPALPPAIPPPLPTEPPRVQLEVGLGAATGIGTDRFVPQLAGAAQAVLGRRWLGAALGGFVVVPNTVSVGGMSLRQWRVSLWAGGRARRLRGVVRPFAELGAAAALLSERATELPTSRGGTAFEAGLHAAAGVRFGFGRATPFLVISGELLPRPTGLAVLPRGTFGDAPWAWVSAMVGIAFAR